MEHLRKSWVSLISIVIWLIEKTLFYPKLSSAYKELNLSKTGGDELIIFDVGANKGQSVKFFKSIYPKSKLYAFEPSANTFSILEKLSKKLVNDSIEIFQVGVGEFEGIFDFHESILDETSTFALPNQNSKYLCKKNRILFQKSENAFKTIPTSVITIDGFAKKNKIRQIDILKIDVEGFEFEVLRGSVDTLSIGNIRIIQFERHEDDMREDNSTEIHEYLEAHGFSRIKEIKHPFGNFFEMIYQKSRARG